LFRHFAKSFFFVDSYVILSLRYIVIMRYVHYIAEDQTNHIYFHKFHESF